MEGVNNTLFVIKKKVLKNLKLNFTVQNFNLMNTCYNCVVALILIRYVEHRPIM